jgi:hypothetical protein
MYKYLLILIFVLSYINYNKRIYKWHNKNIYPFDKKLTDIEKRYINMCINISFLELLRPLTFNSLLKRLSYYTYSNEIKNNNVNSSRLAYGSVMFPSFIYKYAMEVLKERNIEISMDNEIFGGLGWDIDNDIFKIYYIFKDYRKYTDIKKDNILKGGIISFSYKNNKFYEKKIYLYSVDGITTYLISDKRKEIQRDVYKNKNDISNIGKEVISKYEKSGYKLDTINYRDKNNYVLYFPF